MHAVVTSGGRPVRLAPGARIRRARVAASPHRRSCSPDPTRPASIRRRSSPTPCAVFVTAPARSRSRRCRDPPPARATSSSRSAARRGSDGFYIQIGGIPPRQGETPWVTAGRRGRRDRRRGIRPRGGRPCRDQPHRLPLGDDRQRRSAAVRFRVPAHRARGRRRAPAIMPKDVPWHVAALNEPMAVAARRDAHAAEAR